MSTKLVPKEFGIRRREREREREKEKIVVVEKNQSAALILVFEKNLPASQSPLPPPASLARRRVSSRRIAQVQKRTVERLRGGERARPVLPPFSFVVGRGGRSRKKQI